MRAGLVLLVLVGGCGDQDWSSEVIAEGVTGWVTSGADATGRIHAAYDAVDIWAGIRYRSQPQVGDWGELEAPVPREDGVIVHVDRMVVDPAGGAHLLFVRDGLHRYVRRAPAGGWGGSVNLPRADFAEIAAGADGSAHLVYQADDYTSRAFSYLPVASDGSVGTSEDLVLDEPFALNTYPFVAVAPDGTVHVMIYSMGIGTMRHFRRTASGWSEEAEVPLPGPVYLAGVAFAIDTSGTLHLLANLQASDLIYLQRAPGGDWTSETAASLGSSAAVGNSATMVVDPAGDVHIAYGRAKSAGLLHESFTVSIHYARRAAAGGPFETELVDSDGGSESIDLFLVDGCPHVTQWDRDVERALHASPCL